MAGHRNQTNWNLGLWDTSNTYVGVYLHCSVQGWHWVHLSQNGLQFKKVARRAKGIENWYPGTQVHLTVNILIYRMPRVSVIGVYLLRSGLQMSKLGLPVVASATWIEAKCLIGITQTGSYLVNRVPWPLGP